VRLKISIIIPVKNEADNINTLLDHLPLNRYEIIIVDGNSTDKTVSIALEHKIKPNVIVQQSSGKGAALSAGFKKATGDLIIIIDADGSMNPKELPRFIEKFPEYDVVKGSRYLPGAGSADLTLVRSLGNRSLTKLANYWFNQNWTDMAYGYAAFKRETLEDLALMHIDKLGNFFGHKSYGQGFEIETLIFTRAAHRGLKVCEIPSYEFIRNHGTSNLRAIRDGIRVLLTLFVEKSRNFPKLKH
jgi:glycosyltransferase involved in cell wall biosynthesis